MKYKKIAIDSIKLLKNLEFSGTNNSCPECCGDSHLTIDRPIHKHRCQLAKILSESGISCFFQSKLTK